MDTEERRDIRRTLLAGILILLLVVGVQMCTPVTVETSVTFDTPLDIPGKNWTVSEAKLKVTSPMGAIPLASLAEVLS